MKNKSAKGFTLAELLIVMAIIVVLAAVAVPTFGKQLETARETGDMEVIRNAYTEALSFAIQDGADGALDGYIGAPAATLDNVPWGAVTHIKSSTKYEVDLNAMGGAKFAQNASKVAVAAADSAGTTGKWTYVSNKLMGYTVPPVSTMVKFLVFEFQFSDGEVVLKGVKINDTEGSLFTPYDKTQVK